MSSVNSMYQFHDYFGLEQASAGTGVVFVSPLFIGLGMSLMYIREYTRSVPFQHSH
jgi:hypothetical protein